MGRSDYVVKWAFTTCNIFLRFFPPPSVWAGYSETLPLHRFKNGMMGSLDDRTLELGMWMIITRFIGLKMCRKSFGRWVSITPAFIWVLSRPTETDMKPTPFHLVPLLSSTAPSQLFLLLYYNIERLCLNKCHSEYDRQWMVTLRNMLILYLLPYIVIQRTLTPSIISRLFCLW